MPPGPDLADALREVFESLEPAVPVQGEDGLRVRLRPDKLEATGVTTVMEMAALLKEEGRGATVQRAANGFGQDLTFSVLVLNWTQRPPPTGKPIAIRLRQPDYKVENHRFRPQSIPRVRTL